MKEKSLKLSKAELDDLLFSALYAVYRFERQKINSFGLDYTSILALQILRRSNPQRMKELVDALGLPFSSATRLFGKLEESGYVKRVYAQDDKRGVHVYLTDSGDEIVQKIEDDTYRIINETSKLFDAQELNSFILTAKNMAKILDVEHALQSEKQIIKKEV